MPRVRPGWTLPRTFWCGTTTIRAPGGYSAVWRIAPASGAMGKPIREQSMGETHFGYPVSLKNKGILEELSTGDQPGYMVQQGCRTVPPTFSTGYPRTPQRAK